MSTIANPCTVCGKPGIPGLVAGAGKCQYHWNVGAYGQAWADEAQLKALHAHYREQRRGYGFTALPFDHWIQAGHGERALAHFKATGHMPGEYIGPRDFDAKGLKA